MIPLRSRTALDRIEHQIAQIHDILEALRQERDDLDEQRGELQKQVWSRDKEINLLKEATKSVGRLQVENRDLHQVQSQVRSRLENLLGKTKALADGLRQ